VHHAKRCLRVEEHRALLDVHLDVAARREGSSAARDAPRDPARRRASRRRADAVGVAALERFRIETPDERAAREEARLEARALLVRERRDLQRDRQALAALRQLGDARDRHEDAEHAVELAAVAHRVEVRAHEERLRAARSAFVPPDDVADAIDTQGHPASRIQAAIWPAAARCAGVKSVRV
jgi:hypothetical protein